jgi:hypothetical protein
MLVIILAKPAVVNGVPRSDRNTNSDCWASRCSRRSGEALPRGAGVGQLRCISPRFTGLKFSAAIN